MTKGVNRGSWGWAGLRTVRSSLMRGMSLLAAMMYPVDFSTRKIGPPCGMDAAAVSAVWGGGQRQQQQQEEEEAEEDGIGLGNT